MEGLENTGSRRIMEEITGSRHLEMVAIKGMISRIIEMQTAVVEGAESVEGLTMIKRILTVGGRIRTTFKKTTIGKKRVRVMVAIIITMIISRR